MSEESKPALTAEEWAKKRVDGYGGFAQDDGDGDISIERADWLELTYFHERERHALAALCLYGQPFGFTREDVEALDYAALLSVDMPVGMRATLDRLRSRISALLPPE